MTRAARAIRAAEADLAVGVKYVFGAKPPLSGALRPGAASDCSGAVRRWVAQAGVTEIQHDGQAVSVVDFNGSVRQRELCHDVPVSLALGPQGVGCLLFITPHGARAGHVALSLGDGWTIECRGHHGVCKVGPAENRRRGWEAAGKLPELFVAAD